VFGAQGPYLHRHDALFAANLRWLDSSRHFAGSAEQFQRAENENNVVNRQRILDLSGTYQVNTQESVSLSIPILLYGSWSIPRPLGPPPGPRFTQESSGLGDIVLTYRRWMIDTEKAPNRNYSIGFGVKFPTGDPHVMDDFPDNNGQNIQPRPVDSSIQPGDGGWGVVFDVQGFHKLGNVTLFGSGTYLANPKNVNGTPRSQSGPVPPDQEYRRFYSVPDQYLIRLGAIVPIRQVSGLNLSIGARLEGVPPDDFIGGSDGFRRPGHALFIEPGLIYARGRDTWSIHAPVAIERRRDPDTKGRTGDATFADYILLFGYSHRFGK
jgi:hypothetical protein